MGVRWIFQAECPECVASVEGCWQGNWPTMAVWWVPTQQRHPTHHGDCMARCPLLVQLLTQHSWFMMQNSLNGWCPCLGP
jgi:hypothetical protein